METVPCAKHGDSPAYKEKTRLRCKRCNVEAVTKRRRTVKRMAVEYKGGKCIRCGYSKCITALQFHHRDPAEKDFGIGAKGGMAAWSKLKIELDKCDLLCSNCHAEIHAEDYAPVMESGIHTGFRNQVLSVRVAPGAP